VRLYAYDGASAFDLADAKAHGAILITGYIVGHPGGMDPITARRVHQIHELGMGFLPNWERGASYLVTASHAQALAAGNEAVAALRALGVPDDGSIACPFSWDVNVAPSQYAHCGAVADGIIEALAGRYRFTGYGQGGLIDYFARTGRLQSEGWLSASSSFPGYDAASPRVALVQRVGSPVPGTDQNIVTDPAGVHAWWPPGSPYAPAPAQQEEPCPTQDVIDALKTAEGKKLVGDAVWGDDVIPVGSDPANPTWAASSVLRLPRTPTRLAILGKLDPAKLAAAIAAALPAGNGIDPATLTAAVEQGVRAVFSDAATP
jgi:hypothetical protein